MAEMVMVIGRHVGRREMLAALRRAHYRVCYAEAGPEAQKILEYQPPCAVIMDEDQRSQQGGELLEVLREVTSAPIIVEGSGEEQKLVRALVLGADAYLHWSASPETILAYLQALLRREPLESTGLQEHRKPSIINETPGNEENGILSPPDD